MIDCVGCCGGFLCKEVDRVNGRRSGRQHNDNRMDPPSVFLLLFTQIAPEFQYYSVRLYAVELISDNPSFGA